MSEDPKTENSLPDSLQHLHKDAAGRAMTEGVPTLPPTAAVGDIETMLKEHPEAFQTINYVYVIGKEGDLEGTVSIGELFRQPKTTTLSRIMTRELITARPHTDREHVARLALKHNLKAIPIVDKDNHFLGVVPSDTILDILRTESLEDTLKAAGIHSPPEEHDAILASKTGVNVRRRLPWLFAGLLGGFGAASLVRAFEEALSTDLLLTAFIPTIVYMADAVGTQVQTVLIRALAVEHEGFPLKRYFRREAAVNLVLSVLLGGVAGLIGMLFFDAPNLGLILGFSLFATILAASAVAATLPFLFLRFNIDPAIASGPLATIIRDLMSLLIYFLIAKALL